MCAVLRTLRYEKHLWQFSLNYRLHSFLNLKMKQTETHKKETRIHCLFTGSRFITLKENPGDYPCIKIFSYGLSTQEGGGGGGGAPPQSRFTTSKENPRDYPCIKIFSYQGSYKKLQPYFKDFSKTTLEFQGPPTRNIILQIIQKSTFPVYSNKTLRLEPFASPTSLHFSVHLS